MGASALRIIGAMVEKILAALGLLACIGLAVHMVLPRALMLRWRARLLAWWRDPLGLKARTQAKAATEAAIQHARRAPRGRWQGNVYRLGEKGDEDEDGGDEDGDQDRRTLH